MKKKQTEICQLLIILFVLFVLGIAIYWLSSMNTFTETFIPAIMMLIANIFSREHGSHRYEKITALFGWTAVIFFSVWLTLFIINTFLVIFHSTKQLLVNIQQISFQIFILSIVAALSRDYEKLLKPKAYFLEEKLISFYNMARKKFKQ